MRELILVALLAASGVLVVVGVAVIWGPVAWIVAGLLLAALALFATWGSDTPDLPEPDAL